MKKYVKGKRKKLNGKKKATKAKKSLMVLKRTRRTSILGRGNDYLLIMTNC